MVAGGVVVGPCEAGSRAPDKNNLQVTRSAPSPLPLTSCWGLSSGCRSVAARCLFLINPCLFRSFPPDLFSKIISIRRPGFMPLSWSHERVGLEYAHGFFLFLLPLSPSLSSDMFFTILCAGKGPIHIWTMAYLLLPLPLSFDLHSPRPREVVSVRRRSSAVPGRASSSVWSMVVLASPAGGLCPRLRVLLVGDSAYSRSAASTSSSSWKLGAVGLRPMAPPRWWQPVLRLAGGAAGQRRRRVESALPRKASSRCSWSAVAHSPEASNAQSSACVRNPTNLITELTDLLVFKQKPADLSKQIDLSKK